MINKKAVIAFSQIFLLISMTFAVSYMIYSSEPVKAAGTLSNPSVCCEKTISGGYCINTNESSCDSSFKSAPTSCQTTSYCKLGTCYDSSEGICMENTPQRVCQESGGSWDERKASEIPQCQLGCCVLADQAAFVPLVRCKKLSSLFGLDNDYRKDITNELDCIATAQSQDLGACVFEKEFERTCEFTTRSQCGAANIVETVNGTNTTISSEKRFYKDYLCSAEELATSCARQATTNCYAGKVHWFDSCGNRENVYSSDKDKSWNSGKVLKNDAAICPANDGSDSNCGNCDYLLGSRCSEYEGILGIGKPSDGNYFCEKTECVDAEGNDRKNGESWCIYDASVGEGSDPVGSRHYKQVCVDGDVQTEACADFRQQACLHGVIETEDEEFETAACRVNRWQSCLAQTKEKDCSNIDKRDCLWLQPIPGLKIGDTSSEGGFSNPTSKGFSNPAGTSNTSGGFSNPTGNVISPITGMALFGGDKKDSSEEKETSSNRQGGVCVPNIPVGLEFWKDGEAQSQCASVRAKCIIKYEESAFGGKKCIENCECLDENWALAVNSVCRSVGDCGGYVNYVGKYTDDGYEWKVDGSSKKFSSSSVGKITTTGTSKGGDGSGFLNIGVIAGGLAGTAVIAGLAGIGGTASAGASMSLIPTELVNGLPVIKDIGGAIGVGKSWVAAGAFNALLIGGIVWGGAKLLGVDNADAIGAAAMVGLFAGSVAGNLAASAGASASQIAAATAAKASATEAVKVATANLEKATAVAKDSTTFLNPSGTFTSRLGVQNAQQELSTAKELLNTKSTELASLGKESGWATNAGTINLVVTIGVAILVYYLLAKDESTEVVEFSCLPWQAPAGGNDCEKCNDDELACSEYRCQSLGQACELVNPGTSEERCVYVNPRDTNPPIITPNKEELTYGYEYTNIKPNPPNAGLEIVKNDSSNKCVKAFEKLKFGIDTNEPAQCRIDIEHKKTFDEMAHLFGGSNLYAYNHTEQLILPSSKDLKNGSIVLNNGNEMNLYIRCRDKNGNTNSADYNIRFCVDESPDNTAPQIQATSIINEGCVAADTDSANVEFYANEPVECRWSPVDQDYDSMKNQMTCTNQIYQLNALQLYTCRTTLLGIARDNTDFYIRCKDQPGKPENDRNENKQSYKFSLRGSTGLKIKNLMPNSTVYGSVNPAPVELYVETLFGCDDGKAICYYSDTGNENDYIMFYDTNTEDKVHTQRLDLTAGKHEYYYKCVDSGGNSAVESTRFTLDIDTSAPVVARIYEEDAMLKVVTVRDSECAYSFDDCDFSFQEGTPMPYANSTNHVTEWKADKTYYIKCRDEFRNEEADCSAVVRPTKNFL